MTGLLSRRMVYPLLGVTILLFLMTLLSACGGQTATEEPEPTDAAESVGFEELLRAIPDTPENRHEVSIDDYTVARRLFDSPLPGPGDDEDALQEFYDWRHPIDATTMGDTSPVLGFGSSFFSPYHIHRGLGHPHIQHLASLAFDIRSIDQTITADRLGASLDVTLGRFDPEATDEALRSCSECPTPDREEYGGVSYYSWGQDNEVDSKMALAPPAFDVQGRGGRLAVLDSYVLRTQTTDGMKSVIGALRDERTSLADFEEYRLLATSMSQLGVYSMLLTDNTFGLEASIESYLESWRAAGEDAKEVRATFTGPGTLRPYQAFATGAGKGEHGPYMALALVHANSGLAEENVELLRRRIEEGSSSAFQAPWSDIIDVASLEIRSEGRLLLAKLRGEISINFSTWVSWRDNLIVHD